VAGRHRSARPRAAGVHRLEDAELVHASILGMPLRLRLRLVSRRPAAVTIRA
jgi:hypothetical protein